jgi:hypothetical protein
MTTSRDDTTARLTVSIVLRDATEFDVTVCLDVQRLQRCRLWIGPRGFGSATIAGTPELFHALAKHLEAAAVDADLVEIAAVTPGGAR